MKASAANAVHPEDYAQTAPGQANPESGISFPPEPYADTLVEKVDAPVIEAFNNAEP
jgi:hypothetical protein